MAPELTTYTVHGGEGQRPWQTWSFERAKMELMHRAREEGASGPFQKWNAFRITDNKDAVVDTWSSMRHSVFFQCLNTAGPCPDGRFLQCGQPVTYWECAFFRDSRFMEMSRSCGQCVIERAKQKMIDEIAPTQVTGD